VIKILVSSCLLGVPVRYDGLPAAIYDAQLEHWHQEGRLVLFCPEVAGRYAVPRPPAEIVAGSGEDVLEGRARVATRQGRDVTEDFLFGARAALALAREAGARLAILKDRSPSCGAREIYDGNFAGARRAGQGVTAALLSRSGIRVFTEREIAAAAGYLATLEPAVAAGGGRA
jgi:uncharacterized protein YbbK (DUF523 family)